MGGFRQNFCILDRHFRRRRSVDNFPRARNLWEEAIAPCTPCHDATAAEEVSILYMLYPYKYKYKSV